MLPGGTTYLGPSLSPQPTQAPVTISKTFTVSPTTPWVEHKGKVYPFTFSYPETMKLTLFPGDQTDSIGFGFNGIPPQNIIIFRVSDINKIEPSMTQYINKPKIDYVKNWWTQYTGGLKGVKSVEEFVNAKGMKGYKAKYLNHANQTPNDDVFFEIPGRPELMVRFGNGPIDAEVFSRIIDSFAWGKSSNPLPPTAAPTPAQ